MKRFLIIAFLLFLGLFLFLGSNIYIAKKFLAREAKQRVNPTAAKIEKQLSSLDKVPITVIYGDSRVSYWKNLPDNTVAIGSPGATAVELNTSHINILSETPPKKVFIQCGINDLKSLAYTGRSVDDLVKSTSIDIRGIVQKFIKAGVGEVTVISVIPASTIPLWRRVFWSDKIEIARLKLNQTLKENNGEYIFLEIEDNFLQQSDYIDELHFSKSGYDKLNSLLNLKSK